MSIATVATRGYGTFGSIADVATRGYIDSGPAPTPTPTPTPTPVPATDTHDGGGADYDRDRIRKRDQERAKRWAEQAADRTALRKRLVALYDGIREEPALNAEPVAALLGTPAFKALPASPAVDWTAILDDLSRANALIALLLAAEAERQDEEDILMLLS